MEPRPYFIFDFTILPR